MLKNLNVEWMIFLPYIENMGWKKLIWKIRLRVKEIRTKNLNAVQELKELKLMEYGERSST